MPPIPFPDGALTVIEIRNLLLPGAPRLPGFHRWGLICTVCHTLYALPDFPLHVCLADNIRFHHSLDYGAAKRPKS